MTMLYDIPEKLMAGWRAGLFRLDGAMIKQGNRIVGHVVPKAGTSAEQLTQALGAHASSAIGALVPALQVVNLAVNVAGFAYLAHQIDGVSRQIAHVADQLKIAVADGQANRRMLESELAANILAGIEEAARGERLGDSGATDAARRQLYHAFAQHVQMMLAMVQDGTAANQLDAFSAYYRRSALLAVAVARCDWMREGPAQARETLASMRRQLHVAGSNIENAFRTQPLYVEQLLADPGHVRDFRVESRGLLAVLDNHVAQLAFSAMLALPPAGWASYVEVNAAEAFLLIPAQDGAQQSRPAGDNG